MIYTEQIEIRGRQLVRTYSDSGYMVERDGVRYAEAIDPAEYGRTYTESDVPLEQDEATAEDYQDALAKLGVDV